MIKAKDAAHESLYANRPDDEYFNMTKYLEESARTASGEFHTDLVPPQVLLNAIAEVQISAKFVDNIKKALFYGKEDSDLAFTAGLVAKTEYIPDQYLVHAILGIYTEAAELLELLGLALQGEHVPREKLINEAGDSLWYKAMLFRLIETNFEEVADLNIAKLRKRFPVKFTEDLAVNRDEAKENVVFE